MTNQFENKYMVDLLKQGYQAVDGNLIHETARIFWDYVKLGKGNVIGPYTVIGAPGEIRNTDFGYFRGVVRIGSNNRISEHVTIQRPHELGSNTAIGSNNIIMAHVHIGHNALIRNNVEVCTSTVVGGYARIMNDVKVKLNCTIRNRVTVDIAAVVGMGSVVTKSIPAGQVWYGNPAKNAAVKLETAALSASEEFQKLQAHVENIAEQLSIATGMAESDVRKAMDQLTGVTPAKQFAEKYVKAMAKKDPKFKIGDWVRQNRNVDPHNEGAIFVVTDVINSQKGAIYLVEGAYAQKEDAILPEAFIDRIEHRVRRPGEQLILLRDINDQMKKGGRVVTVGGTQDIIEVVAMDGDKLYPVHQANHVRKVHWTRVTSANKFYWQAGQYLYPKGSEGYLLLERLAEDTSMRKPGVVNALLEDWLCWQDNSVSLDIDTQEYTNALEALTDFVNDNYRRIIDAE